MAIRKYVKRMVSVHWENAPWQMGQFALGEKPYAFDKNCTRAVPHNITLFVELEITIVPKSICSWLIDQRSEVLSTAFQPSQEISDVPVVVVPCVLTLPSLCDLLFCFQLGLYIRECTRPRCTCPSSSAVFLIGVFSRKSVEVCVSLFH